MHTMFAHQQDITLFTSFINFVILLRFSMKTHKILLLAAMLLTSACTPEDRPGDNSDEGKKEEQEKPIAIDRTFYAKGADISWCTQMESEGMKFYNKDGQERECTALMKEIGMNSIRLRVWVNPKDGWNGKEDVLTKALRAQKLGMNIMIDFHYSDTWADPGHQTPPAAWSSFYVSEMAEAVAAHTTEVLSYLKDHGVDVRWVQIGNEVNSGMLWPKGEVKDQEASIFITFLNAGHDAAKKIYPDAAVIVHLSNGNENGMYQWFFKLMKAGRARYDMIGMSLYPIWWENSGWNNWKIPVDACLRNISTMIQLFGKPVMICETGGRVHEPELSRDMLSYFLDKTRNITGCHGVFYWEPQSPKGYNDGYEMGAFADGKPTVALDPFMN